MTVHKHACPEHTEGEAPFVHQAKGEGFCQKCGVCLYNHSTQIPDDEYPLFSCKKCGQVNFWD